MYKQIDTPEFLGAGKPLEFVPVHDPRYARLPWAKMGPVRCVCGRALSRKLPRWKGSSIPCGAAPSAERGGTAGIPWRRVSGPILCTPPNTANKPPTTTPTHPPTHPPINQVGRHLAFRPPAGRLPGRRGRRVLRHPPRQEGARRLARGRRRRARGGHRRAADGARGALGRWPVS